MRVAIVGIQGFGVGDYHSAGHIGYCLGANTGNLLFLNAVKSLFEDEYDYTLKPGGEFLWAGLLQQRYDLLLCPMANHLSETTLSAGYVNYMEKANLPILPIGLGMQAALGEDLAAFRQKFLNLPHGARFIAILNERAKCVCTRGPTSAKVLADLGFKNEILVTGCPSATISANPNLGRLLVENLAKARHFVTEAHTLSYIHNLPSFLIDSPFMGHADRILVPTVQKTRLLFPNACSINIQQSLHALNQEKGDFSTSYTGIQNYTGTDSNSNGLVYRIFFNLECWAQSIQSANLSVGSRIHGNILATQFGIPALLYSHDQRVEELSTQTGIPSISLEKLDSLQTATELLDCINIDSDAYDSLRRENSRNFHQALTINNLKPSKKIRSLAAFPETEACGNDSPE